MTPKRGGSTRKIACVNGDRLAIEPHMQPVVNFVSGWSSLISGLFADHPLVGALVTLAAVGVFVYLEKENRSRDRTQTLVNSFLVVLSWAIVVPIAGWVFDLLGWTASGVSFIYHLYASQPVVVIVILLLSIAAYFLLGFVKRPNAPGPVIRAIVASGLFIILSALVVPIFMYFAEEETHGYLSDWFGPLC
jgi:hypothetical protein